jgi:FSR family fosmidomycin resistance protein-like MFS transporter
VEAQDEWRLLRAAIIWGAAHFVIELGCSYALTLRADRSSVAALGIQLFNLLAFGLQPVAGRITDRYAADRLAAVLGALLVAAGLCTTLNTAWGSFVLLGVGNAFFHVGAGSQCVRLSRGGAGALGLFIGPGAFGVTVGVGLARTATPIAPVLVAGALAVVVWAAASPSPAFALYNESPARSHSVIRVVALVGLLLVCIVIRSFVGLGYEFDWNVTATSALALALSMAFGKMCGGVIADRIGWVAASTSAICLSVPLLCLGRTSVSAGLLGTALFQIPAGVTLVALVKLIPTRSAYAFGLGSAAVYGGLLLVQSSPTEWMYSVFGLTILSLLAVAGLVLVMRQLRRIGNAGRIDAARWRGSERTISV